MTYMYKILAIAGWAWLVVVAVFLVVRLMIVRRRTRGFDVIAPSATPSETSAGGADARK